MSTLFCDQCGRDLENVGHDRDCPSLFAALGLPTRELARLQHDDRLLVVRQSGSGPDLRVIIANEDDVAAQSIVLTDYEVRWLVYRVFGNDDGIPRWRFWRDDLRSFWWRLRRVH